MERIVFLKPCCHVEISVRGLQLRSAFLSNYVSKEALADLDNVNLVKLVLGFRLEPIFTTVKVTTKT